MTDWTRESVLVGRRAGAARGRQVTALLLGLALGAASARAATDGGGLDGPDPASLFTGPGSGSGSSATGGAVVAVVELDAPQQSPFVLRATIPVPERTFPRKDGQLPLALRNSDGKVVPTQIEIVSRYASAQAGADVIEVLARVDLPPGVAAGQRVKYAVVEHLHERGLLPLDPDLVQFLVEPGHAFLVAVDVFGHRYRLDLFESVATPGKKPRAKLLRQGQAAVQLRTYDAMRPVGSNLGAPNGALPHFFGVHAYVTAWAETRALSLDLRVHNGFDGYSQTDRDDDPLGKVYFRTLELWLPAGWAVVPDVQDAAAAPSYEEGGWVKYPLVAPRSDGKPHVMPHQSHFQRRLAIAHKPDVPSARSVVQDEGQAFCRRGKAPGGAELWSWWNADTARYFPQRHRLPELSFMDHQVLANQLADTYHMARTALETGNPGNYAVPSPALGWAHPWGIAYAGMTGAIEINLYDGVQLAEVGTNKGWNSVRLAHRMNVERQRNALYGLDGEPTQIEKWVQHSTFPYVDMNFWMTLVSGPDPFGFNDAPKFQVQFVQGQGLAPGYESALEGYMPHDFQHYVRYTRSPKVLAWLGNDALAKDDLLHAAEIARMSMHEYPNGSGKSHTGSFLFALAQQVQNHPNNGIPWGRGEAWSLDAIVAAYSLGAADYRAQVLPWLQKCADLVAQGQVTCSGFIMASYVSGWLSGQYLVRSQPEHTIVEHSLWGLTEAAFRGADPGRTAQCESVLADATRTVMGPISWSESMKAPWFLAATAPLDLALPAYCHAPPPNGVGSGGESFFSWASFGYGFELTGDPEYLQKAAAMSGHHDPLAGLLAKLANGNTNVEAAAALIALLQAP